MNKRVIQSKKPSVHTDLIVHYVLTKNSFILKEIVRKYCGASTVPIIQVMLCISRTVFSFETALTERIALLHGTLCGIETPYRYSSRSIFHKSYFLASRLGRKRENGALRLLSKLNAYGLVFSLIICLLI